MVIIMKNLKMMWEMSKLVKPLWGYMLLAVMAGVSGFLCAILIPFWIILGIHNHSFWFIAIGSALLRGVLRYLEQACNHYIAFKLLALIRDQIFEKLCELAPAKLDNKNSGDLVYMITNDIEALEVFYAHTISPILIALITSVIMLLIIGHYSLTIVLITLISYLVIGVIIPMIINHYGEKIGDKVKADSSKLSNTILEVFSNLNIVKMFNQHDYYLKKIIDNTHLLNDNQAKLKSLEGLSVTLSNTTIIITGFILIALLPQLHLKMLSMIILVVLVMSSFGPVVAISNLSNNLLITFASARRVLKLLKEKPIKEDICNNVETNIDCIETKALSFAYPQSKKLVLKNINIDFEKGSLYGIKGASGCGKSTLLKLLMQFYPVNNKEIFFDKIDINNLDTNLLREKIGLVNQETYLFNQTIRDNIKLANLEASDEEMIVACQKANIHDFIMKLDKGYDTLVTTLSSGERQRIGLARAFISKASMILLDEPTSNLDILNEASILNNLSCNESELMILVSHRYSTLQCCDYIWEIKDGYCQKI